jgi:GntR family transcriptional regulator
VLQSTSTCPKDNSLREIVVSAPSRVVHEVRSVEIGVAVLVREVLHTGLDQDGEPIEVSRYVHRADRAGLVYQFPVEG